MKKPDKAPLTYAASGVNYNLMDPFKRMAQGAARATAGNLAHFGMQEVAFSRGESAYLIETPDAYLAHVEEGLGTKSLVADAMYALTGRTFYDAIGQDTVAMIVNDMITVGAMPVSLAMHLAAGNSDWFADQQRVADLVKGFGHACDLSRAVWGGGETPTLRGIIHPGTAELSGSAFGIVRPKERLIRANLAAGDVILFLAASGIHANGLTMAQRIASTLTDGYLTPIADGRPYGEALLDPTPIYVPVVDDLLSAGVVPHYAANITGHGWRKLMRATEPFVYIIERIPEPPAIFDFLRVNGPISDVEAYGNLNMGAGFALYLDPGDVDTALSISQSHGIAAMAAGHVEKRGDDKRVVIKPTGIEFEGATLGVR